MGVHSKVKRISCSMTTDLWQPQSRTPRPDGRLAPPAPQVAPRDTATPPPAPRPRPEHPATPEHRKGCPPALSCRLPEETQAPRQSLRATLAFAATTAAEPRRRQPQCSACFTHLRLRARSLRSAPISPDPMTNQQPRFTTAA